jgi:curved DNA-binding protein CbpA
MRSQDPYRILGVGRDASDGQIRAAFRDAIRRAHPDRNGARVDPRSITALVDAWRVLGDPVRRARSDEGYRPDRHGVMPSGQVTWQPMRVRTSLLIKRLFVIALALAVAAACVLFVIAMAQSG